MGENRCGKFDSVECYCGCDRSCSVYNYCGVGDDYNFNQETCEYSYAWCNGEKTENTNCHSVDSIDSGEIVGICVCCLYICFCSIPYAIYLITDKSPNINPENRLSVNNQENRLPNINQTASIEKSKSHDSKKIMIPDSDDLLNSNENQININAESYENSDMCKVCYSKEREVAFRPCGHHLCCNDCGLKLKNSKSTCPVCRKIIKDILRIYN
eukprot:Mrub_09741.p1 GENE.Mrub_09741~~Mrub_09741.p1  ORF type:complete len:233 (-),score=-1.93 Mrub_09741:31-669(-)